MTKEEKRVILVLAIITILVIGIVVIVNNNNKKSENNNTNVVEGEKVADEFVQKLEDGSRVNVSEQLLKTKKIDGLEISNIQLKEIGGQTTLLADVENKTSSISEEKEINVEILDKSGNVLAKLFGIIDRVQPGSKVQLNISVTADVANAYDFKISNAK